MSNRSVAEHVAKSTDGNVDMIEGYFDGREDVELEYPERLTNRGAAYRHGWLNGRDDRRGRPRASAVELRRLADEAEISDRML